MPHNPLETHCPKCDVQLVFTTFEGEVIGSCPNCNFCEAVDPEEPCEHCRQIGHHHNMCPNNIINSDSYNYRANQMEDDCPQLPQDTYDRGEIQEP